MNLLPQIANKERRFKIDLVLTPKQKQVDDCKARFIHLRAGRKFGKTMFTMKKILDWLGPPNACVWMIAPTYRQGRLISWSTIKRMIPIEALAKKPNDADMMIELRNGSQLFYMGSDDPDSLRGPKPTGVIFDEAAYHKPEAWYNIIEPNTIVHKAPVIFVSTPKGFNWFKDLEDEAKRLIGKGNTDWATFHFTSYDNPHISAAELDRVRESVDSMVWRQEYMAEYESAVGRVFNVFQDTERHTRKIESPNSFECWRGIDWGMRDNTGCVWGRVFDRNKLYVYREHAENGLSPASQANIIIQRTNPGEKVVGNVISHDAVRQDVTLSGLTVMWHMFNAGISPIKPSSKDKVGSRAKLQQLFQEDRIVIDPECRKLRKQLLSYEWKDTAMEKTEDGNDDLVDALHYLVELLAFQLFMDARPDDSVSYDQKRAMDKAEKIEQKRRKWPIGETKAKDLEFAGPAGYL